MCTWPFLHVLFQLGVKISTLVGDDDSSAIKRLRDTTGVDIQKSSDLNHLKKNVGNSLYKLKADGHKELSDKVIKYVQKCFMYGVMQNAGESEQLAAALRACVPHTYGDHESCGAWCKHASDPQNYRHSSLPYGKDLSNERTKDALMKLFSNYADNAAKLCHHGSSQVSVGCLCVTEHICVPCNMIFLSMCWYGR